MGVTTIQSITILRCWIKWIWKASTTEICWYERRYIGNELKAILFIRKIFLCKYNPVTVIRHHFQAKKKTNFFVEIKMLQINWRWQQSSTDMKAFYWEKFRPFCCSICLHRFAIVSTTTFRMELFLLSLHHFVIYFISRVHNDHPFLSLFISLKLHIAAWLRKDLFFIPFGWVFGVELATP